MTKLSKTASGRESKLVGDKEEVFLDEPAFELFLRQTSTIPQDFGATGKQ